MSDRVGAKAISLLGRGGITEYRGARVFEAQPSAPGQTPYVVTLYAGTARCTCEAGQRGRRCYHAEAARLYARDHLRPGEAPRLAENEYAVVTRDGRISQRGTVQFGVRRIAACNLPTASEPGDTIYFGWGKESFL